MRRLLDAVLSVSSDLDLPTVLRRIVEAAADLVDARYAALGVLDESPRLPVRVRDLALLEDRERIARELHDTVIQRLFASGLSLEGTARLIRSRDQNAADRIEAVVEDLDVTVKHIRTAIFGLEAAR